MTRIELENRVWLLANHEEKRRMRGEERKDGNTLRIDRTIS